MQYTFYCPTCGAQVAYSQSLCRNCGVTLSWGTQQTTQQQQYSPSCENQSQYASQPWNQQPQYNQQQAWDGQAGWNQSQSYNAQGWGTTNQYSQQYTTPDEEEAATTRFTPAVIALLVILGLMLAGASVAVAMNWTSITSTMRQPPSTAINTPVAQPVQPPTISSFTASPVSVSAGQPATLQWVTTGATDVQIDPGIGKVALSGVTDVAPTVQTIYKLTAANSGGSVTASTTVSMVAVPLPVIDYFSATPTNVNAGDTTTLQWNVTGATSVSVDKGVGSVSASGKYPISPAASDNYTLTATNSTGSVTANAPVTVVLGKAPVIANFTATPATVVSGQTSVLAWTVAGTSAVSLDHGLGQVGGSGTLTVSPKATTTYTLSAAYGTTPVKASVTINVPQTSTPVITAFTSSPAIITLGQSSTLQWNVVGATAVSIDHGVGPVPTSGTMPVSPTTHTTYTLTATSDNTTAIATPSDNTTPIVSNPAATTATATTTISVTQPLSSAINSFTASPTTINAGQSATLQWATSGVTSVSIDAGVGTVAQAGTATVSPATTTIYTLTAVGSSGSPTATVTVTVVPAGIPIITSFTATPTTITAGENAILQWNVSGANSVTVDQGMGVVPFSGTRAIGPTAATTYTLTAQGNNGPATSTVTVTVSAAAPTGSPPVIVSFTAAPTPISAGAVATLQWEVTGATTVAIDQGIGIVSGTGTRSVTPAATTTYTLTATNNTSAVTRTAVVTVQ
jgi:hypothetical protein